MPCFETDNARRTLQLRSFIYCNGTHIILYMVFTQKPVKINSANMYFVIFFLSSHFCSPATFKPAPPCTPLSYRPSPPPHLLWRVCIYPRRVDLRGSSLRFSWCRSMRQPFKLRIRQILELPHIVALCGGLAFATDTDGVGILYGHQWLCRIQALAHHNNCSAA